MASELTNIVEISTAAGWKNFGQIWASGEAAGVSNTSADPLRGIYPDNAGSVPPARAPYVREISRVLTEGPQAGYMGRLVEYGIFEGGNCHPAGTVGLQSSGDGSSPWDAAYREAREKALSL